MCEAEHPRIEPQCTQVIVWQPNHLATSMDGCTSQYDKNQTSEEVDVVESCTNAGSIQVLESIVIWQKHRDSRS